jgi:hypothetical protein
MVSPGGQGKLSLISKRSTAIAGESEALMKPSLSR